MNTKTIIERIKSNYQAWMAQRRASALLKEMNRIDARSKESFLLEEIGGQICLMHQGAVLKVYEKEEPLDNCLKEVQDIRDLAMKYHRVYATSL